MRRSQSGWLSKVADAARTPAQRKAHAVARVAVAPRHHLIVDGEDEALVAGGGGARGEFRGQAAILVEKDLHPFRPRRRGADLLEASTVEAWLVQ